MTIVIFKCFSFRIPSGVESDESDNEAGAAGETTPVTCHNRNESLNQHLQRMSNSHQRFNDYGIVTAEEGSQVRNFTCLYCNTKSVIFFLLKLCFKTLCNKESSHGLVDEGAGLFIKFRVRIPQRVNGGVREGIQP